VDTDRGLYTSAGGQGWPRTVVNGMGNGCLLMTEETPPVLDSTIEVFHYCVMGACCGKQAGADGGLGSATSAATSQPTRPQRRPQPAAEANNLSR
jgi:hypothetical protein